MLFFLHQLKLLPSFTSPPVASAPASLLLTRAPYVRKQHTAFSVGDRASSTTTASVLALRPRKGCSFSGPLFMPAHTVYPSSSSPTAGHGLGAQSQGSTMGAKGQARRGCGLCGRRGRGYKLKSHPPHPTLLGKGAAWSLGYGDMPGFSKPSSFLK